LKKRIILLFSLFCILTSLLYVRLSFLSTSQALKQASQYQSTKTLNISTTRGQIFDCNMVPFVNQNESYTAAVLPQPENFSALLSAVDPSQKATALSLLQGGNPFTIKVNTSFIQADGIHVFKVFNRYRDNQLAPHVIGYLDSSGKGATGIEKAFDSYLSESATTSSISYSLDALRKEIKGADPVIKESTLPSGGVVLTLDKGIQDIIQRAGEKYIKKGAIVMVEPTTGKIKALASFPSYSPNSVAKSVYDEENAPMINRVLSSYNVGSTFKISTTAAALESGISKNLTYTCKGKIDVNGQIFHCYNSKAHGTLNLSQAMEESCNTYFINLAQKLDAKTLVNYASDLSFGKSFELAPSLFSSAGYLPKASELYNPADIGNFSFGQGKLMANPLQVAMMVSSVLNEGKTPFPTLVEGTTDDGINIKREADKVCVTAMQKSTAKTIKDFLVGNVMSKADQMAKPKTVSAGGKTGTAQTGKFIDGEEALQTWFGGFFPADKPKYVAVVLVENGVTGNLSSGPVFSRIADDITAYEKYKAKY
jgi:penicillin-binding protein 2